MKSIIHPLNFNCAAVEIWPWISFHTLLGIWLYIPARIFKLNHVSKGGTCKQHPIVWTSFCLVCYSDQHSIVTFHIEAWTKWPTFCRWHSQCHLENVCHFVQTSMIFDMHYAELTIYNLVEISLKFIPEGPAENRSAFLVLACYWKGHKTLPDLVMTQFFDTMWVTGLKALWVYLISHYIN